jgi:hypothetical protein
VRRDRLVCIVFAVLLFAAFGAFRSRTEETQLSNEAKQSHVPMAKPDLPTPIWMSRPPVYIAPSCLPPELAAELAAQSERAQIGPPLPIPVPGGTP